MQMLVTQTAFQWELCVSVADAAYSTRYHVVHGAPILNLVQIARLRSNRTLYRQPRPSPGKKQRGRPICYGESFRLNAPPPSDEETQFERVTASGKKWIVHLSLWKNVLIKGDKTQHMEKYPFDAVRVQVFDDAGKLIFKKPLWLMVTGQRRGELTARQSCECYLQRYDIEHCFRFSKQKLLLDRPQTPDTRHEENLAWITMLSFAMLYETRKLATEVRYPWEKRKVNALSKTTPVSQVQRDYERIIRGIGTPASIPKTRGKSPGRRLGALMPKRATYPTIRKARPMAARC